MPRVSVILPTYNRANLVGRAIRSVLEQTYQDFELIVVDGSSDNTYEVVKDFSDPRIRYFKEHKKSNAAAARNIGIKTARGEFIAFQDSDDEWLPGKLDIQMQVFSNSHKKIGVVYSDMLRICKKGDIYWHSPSNMPEDGIIYNRALERVFSIGIQTALIKKLCIIKSGLLDERLYSLEDFELFIRLSKYFYFYHINKPLVKYYDTINSVSTNDEAHIAAYEFIMQKYKKDMDKKSIASLQFMVGNKLCQRGLLNKGKFLLFSALRSDPLNTKYLLAAFASMLGKSTYASACRVKNLIRHGN